MNAILSRQGWDDRDTVTVQAAGTEQAGGDDLDEAVAIFVRVRPRLLAIAYRFLASTSEAEDVVQETWVRWQKTDRTVVADPPALLATMTTRLAINVIQSARRRREISMPPSVPEGPDAGDDPATRAENREAVEQAVLIVMESLTPRERAAFVLREAFDYPYWQISEFLDLGAANTRQLVCRSRKRLAAESHTTASAASCQRFLEEFLVAAQAGELTGFEELLAADLPG